MVKNWSDILLHIDYEQFLIDVTFEYKRRGWTQTEFLRQCGIKGSSTWDMIRKQHQFLSLLNFLRIADTLDMSIDKYRIKYNGKRP